MIQLYHVSVSWETAKDAQRASLQEVLNSSEYLWGVESGAATRDGTGASKEAATGNL